MDEKLLLIGTLGELLDKILQVSNPPEGFYLLYAPIGTMLLEETTKCAVILSLHEEEINYVPEIAQKHSLEAVYILSDVKHVIEAALQDKTDATHSDLVRALNYYLYNDAYIDLSK